jgi:ER-bound oxygenase mpaB/B'/Rubber oxygenase, catalytic domain
MAGTRGCSRWTDELLDGMRLVGDRAADEPVRAVLERGGVDQVNAIMETLVRVDQPVPEELPDELEDYLDKTLILPDWADSDRIERGQRLFETWGPQICLCLFCASLPSSYAAANGVQVLDRTAQLELKTDRKRRITETGLFLIDACYVGGLGDDGKGRRTIQKVRLMHAAVRQLIKGRALQQPDVWNFKEFGEPINQEDLAGTRLAFAGAVADSLPRLGVRLAAKDIDAYLHLWNVIGHLLGIDDKLLVHDLEDAIALADTIRRRQFKESGAGRRMTTALLEFLNEITPGRHIDRRVYPALIRHLITDGIADMLDVPPSTLVDDLGRFTRLIDWFLVHVVRQPDRLSRLAQPVSRELLKGMLTLPRGGERPPFAIPDRLARKWELPV